MKSGGAAFDGTNKTFEDFQLDMASQMTYTAIAGKGNAERQASATMLTIIGRSAAMTVEWSKSLVYTGSDDEQKTGRCANDFDPCDEHDGTDQGDREGGDDT